jgi:hypothetical protein
MHRSLARPGPRQAPGTFALLALVGVLAALLATTAKAQSLTLRHQAVQHGEVDRFDVTAAMSATDQSLTVGADTNYDELLVGACAGDGAHALDHASPPPRAALIALGRSGKGEPDARHRSSC